MLSEHAGPDLKWVLLSHLSGENNTPQIAFDAMKHFQERFNLIVTSRREPTEVITLQI